MKRQNRYRAKPCDGFPSRLEKALFDYLKTREASGEISDIRRQHLVELKNCTHCGHRVTWKIDFSFQKDGKTEFAEAKGVEVAEYRRKLKLFKKNPHGRLEIYKGSWRRIHLAEVVECP